MAQAATAARGGLLALAAIGGLTALWATPARAQQPAPVLAGLWEVQSLLTVERRAPGGSEVLPPPQSRHYRLCLGPQRARAPMLPPRLPRGTELLLEEAGYQGSFDEPGPGPARQVDFSFRRLSSTAFEGSHDVSAPARIARLQYFASYLGPDCGELRPTPPAETGEP